MGAWFWRIGEIYTVGELTDLLTWPWDTPANPALPPQEFWVRLLCYIMETDFTEALTPICISLTNLAEQQLHTEDVQDMQDGCGRSRHGGQHPGATWWVWAGGLLRVVECFPSSRKCPEVHTARPKARCAPVEEVLASGQHPLASHSHPYTPGADHRPSSHPAEVLAQPLSRCDFSGLL